MRFATGLSRNASDRQGEQGEIWTEHKFMFIWFHLTFRCEDIWKWAKWFCVKACTGWFFFRCIIMEQFFASYYGMNINDQKFCTMHLSSWCCVAVFDSLFQRVFLCVSACWKEEARSWLSSCMICCEWPLLANWGQHESQCSSCVNTLSYLLLSPSHTHTLHTHSYPPHHPTFGCWTWLRRGEAVVVALSITNFFLHLSLPSALSSRTVTKTNVNTSSLFFYVYINDSSVHSEYNSWRQALV